MEVIKKESTMGREAIEDTLRAASRWLSEDAEALARVLSTMSGWWSIQIGQRSNEEAPSVTITTEKYDFRAFEGEFGDRLGANGTENRPKYVLHRAER